MLVGPKCKCNNSAYLKIPFRKLRAAEEKHFGPRAYYLPYGKANYS
ncbi:MAG: hypothetical protein JWQ28_1508 [Pedobacter sp.]|jgi:hypothetical protein|nr:hypothetical protein [Pedobacter sp.]